ncbi:MAG: VWA domain-containing protein [Tatlockia sp.]|jgi:Ca-activated chloride channel family protein
MMAFHFLRPWWFLALIPWALLGLLVWKGSPQWTAWVKICDPHLLKQLMQSNPSRARKFALCSLLLSAFCMVLSLAGPTWKRLPVPVFEEIQPKVIVLDLSQDMLAKDVTPDRLSRAKFKLHDLFNQAKSGQIGLVVYTGEPFTVSPLTNDAKTIDALLASLSPDIMPVEGNKLDSAMEAAAELIVNAGYNAGQILVLTSEAPDFDAISKAKALAAMHINTSVMPILATAAVSPAFQELASVGQGQFLPFKDTSTDLYSWLRASKQQSQYQVSNKEEVPLWRDEGRWFLLPALLLLLPVFRRGWFERISA